MVDGSETKLLVETYAKMYKEAFFEDPPIEWPRDMKIAKDLLGKYSFAALAQWLRAFFVSTDDFIRTSGYTLPQFRFNLSKLIAASAQTESVSKKSLASMAGIFGTPAVRTPIRDAVAFLAVEFRTEVDAPQRRAFERTLAELAKQPEILLAGAERLVNEAAKGRQFYPMPLAHDLKGACAKIIAAKHAEAARLHLADCDHSSHYIEEPDRAGILRAKRCPCWVRYETAKQLIGQPLSLPSHEEAAS
jgi:hypothetical protein